MFKQIGQTLLMVVGLAAFCLLMYGFVLGAANFTMYEIFMTVLFSTVVVGNYLNVFDDCARREGEIPYDSEATNF